MLRAELRGNPFGKQQQVRCGSDRLLKNIFLHRPLMTQHNYYTTAEADVLPPSIPVSWVRRKFESHLPAVLINHFYTDQQFSSHFSQLQLGKVPAYPTPPACSCSMDKVGKTWSCDGDWLVDRIPVIFKISKAGRDLRKGRAERWHMKMDHTEMTQEIFQP